MSDSHSFAECDRQQARACLNRRQFVLAGAGAVTMLLGDVFPGRACAQQASNEVQLIRLPRQRVCAIGELEVDKPLEFAYPDGHPNTGAMVVKLGRRAGGGIGPDQDVVGFSTICTHMGGGLTYNAEHKLAGPCSEHLTSFDLTRHGLVVAGHATEALPQVVLELEDDTIFATGLVGLLFGYHINPS